MATITLERQRTIENIVEGILSQHELSYPKNSLLEIAKALGAEVYFGDLPESETEGVSGVIEWSNEKANIIINDSFSPKRSTFTLAHELGHLILHPNEKKNRIDTFNYTTGPESLDETEANFFAATLLMPRSKFTQLWSLTGDISAIADYFGVSVEAAENRLLWLQKNILN